MSAAAALVGKGLSERRKGESFELGLEGEVAPCYEGTQLGEEIGMAGAGTHQGGLGLGETAERGFAMGCCATREESDRPSLADQIDGAPSTCRSRGGLEDLEFRSRIDAEGDRFGSEYWINIRSVKLLTVEKKVCSCGERQLSPLSGTERYNVGSERAPEGDRKATTWRETEDDQ